VAWAKSIGSTAVDAANLFLVRRRREPQLLTVGSHIDSQPTGGVWRLWCWPPLRQYMRYSSTDRPRRRSKQVAWMNEGGSCFAPA
jgi:hypothetical protein